MTSKEITSREKAILKELERRKPIPVSKIGPAAFANVVSDGRWIIAPHLKLLSDIVQEAIEKGNRRIIVSCPPRHGKSEFLSKYLPAWFLSRNPEKRILLASYEASFAASWGAKCRQVLVDNALKLPVSLNPNSTAADGWNLLTGGGMSTAGIGGPLTGKGADLFIVDDYTKNSEEAESQLVRNRHWGWWTSTARTRLEPGATVIVLATRWHQDDLIGRLLEQKIGDQWESFTLPAIAESEHDILGRKIGQALWPERYDERELKKIEASVGPRVFSALYQQNPISAEGNIFKESWWKFWKRPDEPHIPGFESRTIDLPKQIDETILSWDMAFEGTKRSDFVAGGVWKCSGPKRILVDLVWDRLDFVRTVEALEAQVRKYPEATAKLIEKKANGAAVMSLLEDRIPGFIPINPQSSKIARATASTPFHQAGNVYIPLYAEWRDRYILEHSAFPHSKKDDAVDQSSQALEYLATRHYEEHRSPVRLTDDEKMKEYWEKEAEKMHAQQLFGDTDWVDQLNEIDGGF